MSDRLLSAFDRLLTLLRPRLAYYAVWEYRVVAASGTGPVKLDARAVSPLCPMPDLAGMTLWPGPSGCYAVPVSGSSVRVAFVDGDPSKPAIVGLDPASEPTIVYLSGTGPAVARVGDHAAVTAVSAPGTGHVTIVAPPGGGPCTIAYGVGPNAVDLTSTITTGSAKVFAP